MIPKHTIDEIFETVKIEEVVGDFVTLKKRGVNLLGLCPFHNEKTPSFTVSPSKGIYKCFGCGEGGNSVSFLMDKEHYNYPEALKYLAKKYNIEVEEAEMTSEQTQTANEKDGLYIITSYANKFFMKSLLEQEGTSIGISYFKERGFTNDIMQKFELGYSPKMKNALCKDALKNSFSEEYLEKSGLAYRVNENEIVDRFKERVIFPIHSFSGRILGFGGRALNKNAKAKYQNSPESLIYNKSKVLYGIYFAKNAISKKDNCYIVEGYTDVIALHQKGIENVVSASGTSLTIDQIKLISRFTKNITILFDGDSAGIKASFRGVDMILKEGMNVKVVPFPENHDPDSYSKILSTEDFQLFLAKKSKDFITFKTSILYSESEEDPIKRVEIIKDIIQSIALIPDYLTRTEYCKICSKILDVKESILLRDIDQQRKKSTLSNSKQQIEKNINKKNNFSENNKIISSEKEIIRLLINYFNEEISFNDEVTTVGEFIIEELLSDNIKIQDKIHKLIFDKIQFLANSNEKISHKYFVNHEQTEISKFSIDMISNEHVISDNWVKKHKIYTGIEKNNLKKTAEKAILSLKLQHIEFNIQLIQNKMKSNTIESKEISLLKNLIEIKKQIAAKIGRGVL